MVAPRYRLNKLSQTSDITRTLVVNRIVDHCRGFSNHIFILDLTPGFNVLGKTNCKMRRQTFDFSDVLHLILEVWR